MLLNLFIACIGIYLTILKNENYIGINVVLQLDFSLNIMNIFPCYI